MKSTPPEEDNVQATDKLYIDGAWVPSTGTGWLEVVNSTTEEVMGRIPEGTPGDVDRAVTAARRAFRPPLPHDLRCRLTLESNHTA